MILLPSLIHPSTPGLANCHPQTRSFDPFLLPNLHPSSLLSASGKCYGGSFLGHRLISFITLPPLPFALTNPTSTTPRQTTTRTGGCGEGGGAEPLQRLSFAPQLISTQNPNGENNTLTHYSADAFTGAHVKTLLCRRSDAPAVCSSPKWACLSPGRQRAECSAAGSPALGVAARRAHQQIGH